MKRNAGNYMKNFFTIISFIIIPFAIIPSIVIAVVLFPFLLILEAVKLFSFDKLEALIEEPLTIYSGK
jgi:hypothetical protein